VDFDVKVRGLVWLGVQAERFDGMAALFETLFGAKPGIDEPEFKLWRLANGALVELFAAGTKPPFGAAPVVGFEVDDLEAAKRDLVAAGAEIVGGYGPNENGYASVHFRAPDGNIYEIVRDPAPAADPSGPSSSPSP
jgi:catechol 2,3-dioxygenase-like lactoylglutathione lyase family enzyme